MKKLLFQFDTDAQPSVFDCVVGYDSGADHVIGYGGLSPDNISALVEGAIFTRAPKEKKNTAIFIGGSDIASGQALFDAIQQQFFYDFRVSIMLDSNGSNTTAAAGVAKLGTSGPLTGKKAVVLAGTGPVGQRAAALLALEGAEVTLTSRSKSRAESTCRDIKKRFGVNITPLAAIDNDARGEAIADTRIVFASGANGSELLAEEHWRDNANIELIADANTTPPLGIGGSEMQDKGRLRHGKIIWGALGFGALKLALQRKCIARLFDRNDQVFDAEIIFTLAKEMA